MYINATELGYYDTLLYELSAGNLFMMQKVHHQRKISKKALWQVDVESSYFSHFIPVVRLHARVRTLFKRYVFPA